jgi:hypothetical protein
MTTTTSSITFDDLPALLRSGAQVKVTTKNYDGKECSPRLFVSENGLVCAFKARSRTRGYAVDPASVVKIEVLDSEAQHASDYAQMMFKTCRMAFEADFNNSFIEACINKKASLFSGTHVDGKVITTKHVASFVGQPVIDLFLSHLKSATVERWTHYFAMGTCRAKLEIYPDSQMPGCKYASLTVYHKRAADCHYQLINNDAFIGYSVG